MRSLILVACSGFVLTLGFLAYFWMQPAHKSLAPRKTLPAPPLVAEEDDGGGMGDIHASDDIYIKKPDKNGNLASEYFADEAKPRKNGQIDVTNPRARFYLNAGQVLEIIGSDGVFIEDRPTKRGPDDKAQATTPNRGRLHNVMVQLLDTTVNDPDEQAVLTIYMDNAAFDAENSTIYSEAFHDKTTGALIPADEVPVIVRGTDYDFDGRGLRMSWNERDRRLAKLDVMHGERLVIKHPAKFTSEQKPATTVTSGSPLPVMWASAEKIVLPVDLDPSSVSAPDGSATTKRAASPRRRGRPATRPVPPPTKFQPTTAPPLYRATFLQNVQIIGLPPQQWSTMSEASRQKVLASADIKLSPHELIAQHFEQLATSDRMLVDFMLKPEGSGNAAPTTAPGANFPTAATATSAPSTQLTTAANVRTGRSGHDTATASTRPTTRPVKPVEPPMYVYWTGPLHVEPYAVQPLNPGEAVVTLEGAPVVAHEQQSEIKAARLIYRTLERDVQADAAPDSTLIMTTHDAHGETIIHTRSMTYVPAKPGTNVAGVAVLRGLSSALMPASADGGKLNATWTQQCTLTFVSLSEGRQAIDRAELRGDVKVDHPQMKLDSQELDLTFDNIVAKPATASSGRARPATAPTSRPDNSFQTNLSTVLATNAVHCVMINGENKVQTIDCDRLMVLNAATPDGHSSPRTINADGRVHAVDAEQDLRAGHLAVTLMPSTRPAAVKTIAATSRPGTAPATQPSGFAGAFGGNVELQSLIAHDSVRVVNSKDGTEATADTLLVDRDKVDGKPTVRLVGQPSAKIVDRGSIIIGPIIILYPDGQQLDVDGGGTMHGTQQETPGATTRPIDVAWDRSLRFDGRKNIVDVLGNVTAVMTDADGSVDVAKGNTAQLFLVDLAPTSQPTTRPTTQAAVGTPTTRRAARGPTTTATAASDSGTGLGRKGIRRAIFQDHAEVGSTLLAADGGLLRRLHVLAETIQYDVSQSTPPEKKITIPVPGRMLVEDYRPSTTQPTTNGQGTGGGARGATAFQWQKSLIYDDATHRMVMEGDVIIDHQDIGQTDNNMRLTGDVVTADLEAMAPLPATKPTTRPAPTEPRYQIKRITSVGNLVLKSRGGVLTAETMEYDPIKHILTARGGNRPTVFTRAQTGPNGTQPMEADELEWDTVSDLPTITKMRGRK